MFSSSSIRLIRTSGMILLSAVLLQLTRAAVADAKEKDRGVTVLGVWLNKRNDTRLTTEVTSRLRELGEDAQGARSPEKSDWGCAETECLRQVADRQHSARLLQSAIEEVDRESHNYLITVRLFDRATGRVEQLQTGCDGCGGDQRIGYIAATAAKLIEKLDRYTTAPGVRSPDVNQAPASENATNDAVPEPAIRKRDSATDLVISTPDNERDSDLAARVAVRDAAERKRTKTVFFASGFAVAGGALAITLSAAAASNLSYCSSDWNQVNPLGQPAASDQSICHATTLGISWGMTAIATTVALVATYSKKRR